MTRTGLLIAGLALALTTAGPGAAAERTAWQNYILRCTGCHGLTGEGSVIGGIPTFSDSVGAIANDDVGRTYLMHVPGVVTANLSDSEIAEVMNFILDRWSDGAPPFTAEEVAHRRAIRVPDVVGLRREVAEKLEAEGKSVATYPWP